MINPIAISIAAYIRVIIRLIIIGTTIFIIFIYTNLKKIIRFHTLPIESPYSIIFPIEKFC